MKNQINLWLLFLYLDRVISRIAQNQSINVSGTRIKISESVIVVDS
ncbi:hypothetical protein [Mangrovivirga cuniculi]|nr:hypothetical protein [Mangrovivirga cuniculi]